MQTDEIEKKLGIVFQDKTLLEQAFTHKSVLNENRTIHSSNERLEYLGDAVLEFIVSEYLFQKFPDMPEGELTNLRTQIVRQDSLSQISRGLKVGEYLQMSQGEIKNRGFEKDSILEDLYESLVGAVFLDAGMTAAKKFVKRTLLEITTKNITVKKDPKGSLQEFTQEKFGITPTYKSIEKEKNGNDFVFISEVFLNEKKIGEGIGNKKLTAEEDAARNAIKIFKIDPT